MKARRRKAYTMIEMLIAMAIMGILIALLLPAIGTTREYARRVRCEANLSQLAIALHHYEINHRSFPSGVIEPQGPVSHAPAGYHQNWIVHCLPYLEEGTLCNNIDTESGVYEASNDRARVQVVGYLACSSTVRTPTYSNYAGVHGDVESPIDVTNSGILFLNSGVSVKNVTDGLSNTLLIGEKLVDASDLGWMSGTRSTLRNAGQRINVVIPTEWPNGPLDVQEWGAADSRLTEISAKPLFVGGFASRHPNGANFALGDGRVQFFGEGIDKTLYQCLANRADGTLIQKPF